MHLGACNKSEEKVGKLKGFKEHFKLRYYDFNIAYNNKIYVTTQGLTKPLYYTSI